MVQSLRSLVVETWKGQRPLWKVFWLYYVLGGFVVVGIMFGMIGLGSLLPNVVALVLIFGAVGFLLVWKVWALVSIWRCGANTSGSTFKYLARGYVVVWVLGFPVSLYDSIDKFKEYRLRGYDAVTKAQVRNAAVAQEAFFAKQSRYTDQAAELYGEHLQAVPKVRLVALRGNDPQPRFFIVGRHVESENAFFFDSSNGQIIETSLEEVRKAGVQGID